MNLKEVRLKFKLVRYDTVCAKKAVIKGDAFLLLCLH